MPLSAFLLAEPRVTSPQTPSSARSAGLLGPVRALLRNRLVNVTLRYGLGFALLAFIVWRYWDVHDEAGKQVGLSVVLTRPLQWSSLALGFAACSLGVLATFVRWFLLVRAQDLPFTFRDAIRLGLVGYFFNMFLPGAVGGDLVKAGFLAREQSRRAVAIATLVLDRVIGLAGLFWLATLLGGGLYFSGAFDAHLVDPEVRWTIQSILVFAAGIAFGSLTAWLLLLLLPTAWLDAIERKFRTLRLVGPTLGELVSAVRIYRQKGRYVAAALGLALLSHSLLVLTFYSGSNFFTPADELPPLSLHLLLVPIGMTIQAGIPLPGGGMGAAEAVFGYLYKLLGYLFEAGVLGALGKRLIEFTLGFFGYLVYLRMGPVTAAAKDEVDEHILNFPTPATEPATLPRGEASVS
jgi:glycosyltransferase 2 family protein